MTANDPNQGLVQRLSRATEQAKHGDYEHAILELKGIILEHPGHELATGMLAAIYLQIGMHQKASRYYRKLLAQNPSNPLARFQLGMTRFAQGLPAEAIDTWEPLLETEGEFMAHFHTALALLQLERRPAAHAMLTQASQTMPVDHPLYPQLVQLLAELDTTTETEST